MTFESSRPNHPPKQRELHPAAAMPTIVEITDDDSNSGSRKRVAIDPSAINSKTYKQDASQKNENQAPLKTALDFLYGTIVTLHKDYQSTVKRVGEEFSKAFDVYQRNSKTLAGMIDSTETDGIKPSRIPKSAKLNFELKTTIQSIRESNEFQVIERESRENIETYQQQQAIILIKYKQLEVAYHRKQVYDTLAHSLHTLAKGHQVVNVQPNVDPHSIVMTSLERDSGRLL